MWKKIGGLFFFWRWWPIWWHTKCVVHCEVPRGSEKCWSRMSKVGFETWGLDVCPFFHRMTKLFFPSISHDWTENHEVSAFANHTFQRNFGLEILKTTTKECDKDDEDFRIAIHISQVENHCCSRSSSPRVLTVFVRWSYTKMFVAHCSLFVFNYQF